MGFKDLWTCFYFHDFHKEITAEVQKKNRKSSSESNNTSDNHIQRGTQQASRSMPTGFCIFTHEREKGRERGRE